MYNICSRFKNTDARAAVRLYRELSNGMDVYDKRLTPGVMYHLARLMLQYDTIALLPTINTIRPINKYICMVLIEENKDILSDWIHSYNKSIEDILNIQDEMVSILEYILGLYGEETSIQDVPEIMALLSSL